MMYTQAELNEYGDDSYKRGRKDEKSLCDSVYGVTLMIESQNFTCDQLQDLIRRIEEMKGSDYESSDSLGEDRSEELRDQRGEFN